MNYIILSKSDRMDETKRIGFTSSRTFDCDSFVLWMDFENNTEKCEMLDFFMCERFSFSFPDHENRNVLRVEIPIERVLMMQFN